MNATEALKQARELLREVVKWAGPPTEGHEDCECVFCEAHRFLALPSPVEEGETCKHGMGPTDFCNHGCGLVRRDTSKPEEKRYTMAELELAFDAMVEARTGLDFYETDGSAWDEFRAALIGEKP